MGLAFCSFSAWLTAVYYEDRFFRLWRKE